MAGFSFLLWHYGGTVNGFFWAITPEIDRHRSHRWRKLHTVLNCIALLLLLGQRVTGYRDLWEIPLNWQ
ncbi:DUF4079 family protein [Microcoleus sp. BROC3]|uniref:DUF4079 family protein n=1 Tax=Microcoleus sp. BROC3 TaxID=3055323 RepID=UPI002FD3C6AF